MSRTQDHTRPLTLTERAIVAVLEAHREDVVSVRRIVSEAYGYTSLGLFPANLIRAHVANIRAKGVHIETHRNRGYTLGVYVAPKRWEALPFWLPRGWSECHCGATYRLHTADFQRYPWTACQAHRGARYDRAKAELEAWRRRNAGYRLAPSGIGRMAG